jgi:hypothetical protein
MLNVPAGVMLADSILILKLSVLLMLSTYELGGDLVFTAPKSTLTGAAIRPDDRDGAVLIPLHAISSNKEHNERSNGR